MRLGWRLVVVGAVVAGLFGTLVLRMWFLQVTDIANALETAFEQRVRTVEIEAPRGDIFDRDGKEKMATTVATWRVIVDLALVEDFEQEYLIQNLSALTSTPASQLREEFADRPAGARFTLGGPVSQSTKIFVEENIEAFPGVTVESVPFRVYPLGETASHIVGYVGAPDERDLERPEIDENDQVGKFGVEDYYDSLVRGTPGYVTYSVNAQGAILGVVEERLPEPGGSVLTTIDLGLQQMVEETLVSAILLARQDGEEVLRGAAVVLDPRDGSILAMASVPAFDPAIFSDGRLSQEEWEALSKKAVFNNFAIQGLYPPGSSFKTIVNALAREEKISPRLEDEYVEQIDQAADPTLFYSDGELLFTNTPPLRDWKEGGHGLVDLSESLVQSVNSYYWSIALQIWENAGTKWPEDLLQEFARELGFGSQTGIDLPFEQAGLVPDREWFTFNQQNETGLVRPEGGWSGGDLMNMATGQGALIVTPLQMAVAYGALVNGGTVWEPRVVQSVRDSENNVVFSNLPSAVRDIDLAESTVSGLKEDLNGVVTRPTGTARRAFEGFCDNEPEPEPDADCAALREIGGKTGTAEIRQAESETDIDIDTAWFVGAAPLSDPQYIVAVVIEQGGSGGRVAAPAARRIFQYLMGERPDPVRPGSDTER